MTCGEIHLDLKNTVADHEDRISTLEIDSASIKKEIKMLVSLAKLAIGIGVPFGIAILGFLFEIARK